MTQNQTAEQKRTVTDIVANCAQRARSASKILATASSTQKDTALQYMADAIEEQMQAILDANAKDMEKGRAKGLSPALLDRLLLTPDRLKGALDALRAIAKQDDPVGRLLSTTTRPNGLEISKVSVPLGVIGVIYESRPNVTVDAGALCLKAGNAVILRGGSEAVHSNKALHAAMAAGLARAGLPEDAVVFLPTQDRDAVGLMLQTPGYVDVIVPRGGKSLVARVQTEARVPVFAHLDGICHLYLDRDADTEKAARVILNAKMRRPGICGALETLLVDRDALEKVKPAIKDLIKAGCEIRGDETIQTLDPHIKAAVEADWQTEYLDSILSVKVVDGLRGALDHIDTYSSHHTDGILTENTDTADTFLTLVDSAIVMVNSSTQFADGGEFGMGGEIGIATGRFHARGPVGAFELTSFKFTVRGDGQTRP